MYKNVYEFNTYRQRHIEQESEVGEVEVVFEASPLPDIVTRYHISCYLFNSPKKVIQPASVSAKIGGILSRSSRDVSSRMLIATIQFPSPPPPKKPKKETFICILEAVQPLCPSRCRYTTHTHARTTSTSTTVHLLAPDSKSPVDLIDYSRSRCS